jgi:hypothetical protein
MDRLAIPNKEVLTAYENPTKSKEKGLFLRAFGKRNIH